VQVNRLQWRAGKSLSLEDYLPLKVPPVNYVLRKGLFCQDGCLDGLNVELQPLEIRTFLLQPATVGTLA
jgi:hypothetical protein